MKSPPDPYRDYPVNPEAWERGMERIRALSPYQRVLIDPELLDEALYGETKFLS